MVGQELIPLLMKVLLRGCFFDVVTQALNVVSGALSGQPDGNLSRSISQKGSPKFEFMRCEGYPGVSGTEMRQQ